MKTSTRPSLFRISLISILGIAVLGSTVALSRRDYAFFDPLVDVKTLIAKRFVTEVDEEAMQQAALKGMVEALADPYTVYIPPEDVAEFSKGLTGDFVGVGIQVMMRDGWLTVVTPLEDTPAFRAGVMAEDRIVEIEGESTFGLTAEQCIARLTGKAGTEVSFTVERGGKRIPITVIRERIVTRTVRGLIYEGNGQNGRQRHGDEQDVGGWRFIADPDRNIAYIRLTQFTPTSADEVRQTLTMLEGEDGLGGLILDLRFNPGGTMNDAEKIADMFLREGVIVSTRGRAHQERITRARARETLPDFPLAILVNQASASASEIVAGALAENDRAIVVGMRSFGKGSVQSVHLLPAGRGQLKLTEQEYYLPSGRLIQRRDDSTTWGVDPTEGFYVHMDETEMAEMLRIRRERDVISAERNRRSPGREEKPIHDWASPSWIEEHLRDGQLAAALRAVQIRLDTGDWQPTGDPLPEGKAIAAEDRRRAVRMRDQMLREIGRLERRIELLEQAAGPQPDPELLWSEDVELAGGLIQILDEEGKPVAALSITGTITGTDLERLLRESGAVVPAEEAALPEGR